MHNINDNGDRAADKVFLLGWLDLGSTPKGGETAKNQHMLTAIEDCGVEVCPLDFYRWKRRPWILLKAAWLLVSHPRTPLVLSSSPKNVYPIIKLHRRLWRKRRLVHWVIGGNMHRFLENGEFDAGVLNRADHTIVETSEMLRSLVAGGVRNAMRLPNFKVVDYLPQTRLPSSVRFVFLSRVMPQKGVDLILESMRSLNEAGLSDRYSVDFYGPLGDDYEAAFRRQVDDLPNASYKGFLDMKRHESYDALAGYTAMLFPTHWVSEGFAGVIVDAFIASLPVIATKWAGNPDIIEEGKTGYLIEPHDAAALADRMRIFIEGRADLPAMKSMCRSRAADFDTRSVVTPTLLRHIF